MWVYPEKDFGELSPLVLAYVGDAVYELYVRLYVINQGAIKVDRLHRQSTALVNAGAQANHLHQLECILTDEEKNIVRRGRNVKGLHVPKNAVVIDYRLSTGFEALIGYLFLAKKEARLEEIMSYILKNETEKGE